jgi:protein gp37
MSKTNIEWSQHVWNPVVGCTIISSGCKNCYAMKMAARLEAMGVEHYRGLTQPSKAGAVWTGKVAFAEKVLMEPLRRKKPTTYFVNSMGDLFHEDVPDEWIDKVFAVMALTPWHTYQILTKRPARMRDYIGEPDLNGRKFAIELARQELGLQTLAVPPKFASWPLHNLWLGTSIEDQKRADERCEHLKALAEMGWATMVSYEPALGPVDWTGWEWASWIISGGESGPGARPSHPDWHRAARDFCQAAGVPFFFKAWGEWIGTTRQPGEYGTTSAATGECRFWPENETAKHHAWADDGFAFRVGKKRSGRLLDGREWNDAPGLAS